MAIRNQYTYTPGYSGSNRQPSQKSAVGRPAAGAYGAFEPRRGSAQQAVSRPAADTMVLILLFIVCPLFLVLGLFVRGFLWVFLLAAVLALVAMLGIRCFMPRGRIIFSGVLVAGIAFAAVMLALQTQEAKNPYQASGGDPSYPLQQGGSGGSLAPTPPIGGLLGSATETAQPLATPGPEATTAAPVFSSEAETVMNNYMQMWFDENYEDMVRYTKPEWRLKQEAPSRQLNWNHSGWKLKSWRIEPAAVSPNADALALKVLTNLTRERQTDAFYTCEYSALLFYVDGVWYVDPDSMRANPVLVDPDKTPSPNESANSAEPNTINPTTKPTTKLWYNTDGGTYYHLDQKCKSLNPKFYDKMESFEYSELMRFSKLKPCLECDAPR